MAIPLGGSMSIAVRSLVAGVVVSTSWLILSFKLVLNVATSLDIKEFTVESSFSHLAFMSLSDFNCVL